jgi:hypothetical protein
VPRPTMRSSANVWWSSCGPAGRYGWWPLNSARMHGAGTLRGLLTAFPIDDGCLSTERSVPGSTRRGARLVDDVT